MIKDKTQKKNCMGMVTGEESRKKNPREKKTIKEENRRKNYKRENSEKKLYGYGNGRGIKRRKP
jgi:hypothetical protein